MITIPVELSSDRSHLSMAETIRIADLADRWPEIAMALRSGQREFMVIDGQTTALIVDAERYQRLIELAKREERRRRVLSLPLAGAASETGWDEGFVILERVSEKFAGLSDDDLDSLFGEAVSTLRATEV